MKLCRLLSSVVLGWSFNYEQGDFVVTSTLIELEASDLNPFVEWRMPSFWSKSSSPPLFHDNKARDEDLECRYCDYRKPFFSKCYETKGRYQPKGGVELGAMELLADKEDKGRIPLLASVFRWRCENLERCGCNNYNA